MTEVTVLGKGLFVTYVDVVLESRRRSSRNKAIIKELVFFGGGTPI